MSHTPGPLEAVIECDLDGREYCTRIKTNTPYHYVASGVMEVADGRLFAAAPDLLAVCKAYEQWEADIITDGDWGPSGMACPPKLTEELYDRMIELQEMRNAAIKKAKGEK